MILCLCVCGGGEDGGVLVNKAEYTQHGLIMQKYFIYK